MSGSSDTNASIFEGLEQGQVVALLDVLKDSKLATRSHVARRFLERASRFEVTMRFLTTIGAIRDDNSIISVAPALREIRGHQGNSDLHRELIKLLTQRKSPYRSEMFEYLSHFCVTDGRATYRPTVEDRGDESDVRNYLMELGIVSYEASEDRYVLAMEHSDLYARAKESRAPVSPSEFQARRAAKEEIGLAAEIAVLAHERKRVGAQHAASVDHVALWNVAAGYDIRSVTVGNQDRELPRYIEVKAVPYERYQFFWTANELAMAELFGPWYYLYLLPVVSGGSFDFEKLRITCDPYANVLGPESEWVVERQVVRCCLKTEHE